MLEGEAGGQAQRLLASESLTEETSQNHDALGVRVPTEFGLALDIDDPSLPSMDGRRYPRRLSERIVAQLQNSKAVDLSRLLSLGVNEDLAARDHLADLRLDSVAPVVSLLES